MSQLDENRTYASAGKNIAQILKDKSVLAILNTKAAAWQVYQETMKTLKSQGAVFVAFDKSVPEKDIPRIAENCPDDHILCIHMSTQLCPAHRIQADCMDEGVSESGEAGALRFNGVDRSGHQRELSGCDS